MLFTRKRAPMAEFSKPHIIWIHV